MPISDGDAERRVVDANLLANGGWHGVMRRRRRVADQAFRAAEAHRHAEDAQTVEHGEGFALAASDPERKGRAGTRALTVEDEAGRRTGLEEAEIGDALDLGMIAQEGRDRAGVLVGPPVAQGEGLKRPQQQPAGEWIHVRAEQRSQLPHRTDLRQCAREAPAEEIAVAAGIFGERRDAEVRTLLERLLQERAQEGVVDRHDRPAARAPAERVREAGDHRDVGDAGRRVRGRFDVDQPDGAVIKCRIGRRRDPRLVEPVLDGEARNAEPRQRPVDEAVGSTIERAGVQQAVAGLEMSQQRRRDRRHAGREGGGILGAVERGQSRLQHREIGMVKPRVDVGGDTFGRRPLEISAVRLLGRSGRRVGESGRQHDGRLDRPIGAGRVIAETDRQRVRVQPAHLLRDAPETREPCSAAERSGGIGSRPAAGSSGHPATVMGRGSTPVRAPMNARALSQYQSVNAATKLSSASQ